ncbi:MAG: hypothetical protein ACI8S6_002062 [Myxococcota bacterium]
MSDEPIIDPPLRLSRHDRLQLELVVKHPPLDITQKQVTLDLELWFYLPPAVGIDAERYSRPDFYRDLRTRTRLHVPDLPLRALADPAGTNSPLGVLHALRREAAPKRMKRSLRDDIRQEARLLAYSYRSASQLLLDQLDWLEGEEAGEVGAELAEQTALLLEHFRSFLVAISVLKIGGKTRRCLSYCEEYLSLQAEQRCARALLVRAEQSSTAPDIAALRAVAQEERQWRATQGMRSVLSAGARGDDDRDAAYLDQSSLLKKYTAAGLYLTSREGKMRGLADQVIGGIAAAVAMTWAVGVQILLVVAFGLELSRGMSMGLISAFTAAAIFAYILKDRIKAKANAVLTRWMSSRLFDREQHLFIDGGSAPLANISERVSFISPDRVPAEVHRTRIVTARSALIAEADAAILYYRRRLRVSPRAATRQFPRFDGIKDILRLNVWGWIRSLAEDKKPVVFLDAKGRPRQRQAPNRYIVDVLARYTVYSPNTPPRQWITKTRVILTRRGIQDVRDIPPDPD